MVKLHRLIKNTDRTLDIVFSRFRVIVNEKLLNLERTTARVLSVFLLIYAFTIIDKKKEVLHEMYNRYVCRLGTSIELAMALCLIMSL